MNEGIGPLYQANKVILGKKNDRRTSKTVSMNGGFIGIITLSTTLLVLSVKSQDEEKQKSHSKMGLNSLLIIKTLE